MIRIIRNLARKNLPMFLVVLGAGFFLIGCANNYPTQVIYTDTSEEGSLVTGIQTYQFNLTTGPRYMQAGAAAEGGEVGNLHGASTRYSTLFGLVEWGNNGVGEAARNGGVREIRTVQNGGIDILWGVVYSEQSTIVTGQEAYSNPLPLKFPKETRSMQEGIFLEPNADLVVKNAEDQVLALVKKGKLGEVITVHHQKYKVSYGVANDGVKPSSSSQNLQSIIRSRY